MKFAHFADCHIGGWREQELRELGIESLRKAVDICVQEHVAFVLIAGDLFNTALPQIEMIKHVAEAFHKLKEKDIDIYVIPGSHDYSPSGKTMLDVLEKSGLVTNVMKLHNHQLAFTLDKTGVKITGMYGRRVGLDTLDYASLDKKNLEQEPGFKIFLFHTTLEEFKPKEFEGLSGESYMNMPKGFQYYAGGHVHYLFDIRKKDYGLIVYPGPLFPNNFKELEELHYGRICIVDDQLHITRVPIKLKDVETFHFDVTDKTPEEVREYIHKEFEKCDLRGKIVTLRVSGELISGKVSDIPFHEFGKKSGAYVILKNITQLTSREFQQVDVKGSSIEEIEHNVLEEHTRQSAIENDKELSQRLMVLFNEEKAEGETVSDFEKRLVEHVRTLFEKR